PADGTTRTGSATVDSSTTNWSAVYSAGAGGAVGVWKVASTAVSPSGEVKRVLQQTLQPCTTCTTTVQANPVYGYGFVMGGAPHTGSLTPDQTCALATTTTFGGSGQITVPTWINGDVCVTGGANPAIANPTSGSPITAHIGGALYVNGPDYAVGTPSSKVAS